MSIALTPPDPDLAHRILSPCAYADRLPAGRMTSRMGITRGTVRGLPELHLYLTPDDRTLPAISFDRLAGWIDKVVADPALARQTGEAARAADSYVDACIAVRALVGVRLEQARVTLGIVAEEASRETEDAP